MLNQQEFVLWCQQAKPTPLGVAYIQQVRSSPPARRVQGRVGNVHGSHASTKMGRTIQFESHTVELPIAWEFDFDQTVLEFWDQPEKVKLPYLARNDRPTAPHVTFDFLVLRDDCVGWEECKTLSQLQQLAESQPNRYVCNPDGTWSSPPTEALAAQYGFYFKIRLDTQINWNIVRNLQFLEDFIKVSAPPVEDCPLINLVSRRPGMTIRELLDTHPENHTLFGHIAHRNLWVNLSEKVISRESENLQVFANCDIAQAFYNLQSLQQSANSLPGTFCLGAIVDWDGQSWRIANIGHTSITLLCDATTATTSLPLSAAESLLKQKIIAIQKIAVPASIDQSLILEKLAQASPENIAEANRRYELIAPLLFPDCPSISQANYGFGSRRTILTPALRTLQRWMHAYRKLDAKCGHGYLGLLPCPIRSGNQLPKLPDATYPFVESWIAEDYENHKQKGLMASYALLKIACSEKHITCPSYKTFSLWVQRRPRHEQLTSRKGRRAAYNDESWYWTLNLTTPRHGDWPFQIAHIDHTELDVELVSSDLKEFLGFDACFSLGRPWLTLMIDAFSRKILAFYLSFDPPSYRSVMSVFRECVRNHNRLPRTVVVDGGKDFQGLYFDRLLAVYSIDKKVRPGAKPRYGSILERLFGVANTNFIHTIEGNTQATKTVRVMTSAVNPKLHAVWTLSALHGSLSEWASVHNRRIHPALGVCPDEAFAQGNASAGERLSRFIADDEAFRMLTLPTSIKGTAKILHKGFKINCIYYWSDEFRKAGVLGTTIPVRFDPDDISVAYALIKNRWVQAVSEYFPIFRGRTEREIKLAGDQLREKNTLSALKFDLTAKHLTDFLTSVEGRQALLKQQTRDAEARTLTTSKNPLQNQQIMQDLNSLPTENSKSTDPRQIRVEDLAPFAEAWL